MAKQSQHGDPTAAHFRGAGPLKDSPNMVALWQMGRGYMILCSISTVNGGAQSSSVAHTLLNMNISSEPVHTFLRYPDHKQINDPWTKHHVTFSTVESKQLTCTKNDYLDTTNHNDFY